MRDLPGLNALLDRAAIQAQRPPTYRFHGHRSPANRQRTPLVPKGFTPSTVVKDGIATLRLFEPIDSWGGDWGVSALEFLEVLDQLDAASTEAIHLEINSPGGEVWEALAILNSLRDFDAKVVAKVQGIAASCASFIACAADETIMSPNTQLMIHDAWGLCVGNADDMHETGDILGQVSDNIASVYAAKAGGSVEDWRTTMRDEAWYLAAEAVEAGLADSVAGEEPSDADPADAFDLKGIGLKYNGRAEAPAPSSQVKPAAAPVPDTSGTDERRARMQQRRHAMNERKLTRV